MLAASGRKHIAKRESHRRHNVSEKSCLYIQATVVASMAACHNYPLLLLTPKILRIDMRRKSRKSNSCLHDVERTHAGLDAKVKPSQMVTWPEALGTIGH